MFRRCHSIRLEKRELSKVLNDRNKIQAAGCSYGWKEDLTIATAGSLVSEYSGVKVVREWMKEEEDQSLLASSHFILIRHMGQMFSLNIRG